MAPIINGRNPAPHAVAVNGEEQVHVCRRKEWIAGRVELVPFREPQLWRPVRVPAVLRVRKVYEPPEHPPIVDGAHLNHRPQPDETLRIGFPPHSSWAELAKRCGKGSTGKCWRFSPPSFQAFAA